MLRLRWARTIFWTAAALLLLSLLLPLVVEVNSWQEKITAALSRELGRPVRTGQIRLKLLGGPGFEIENVVVGEDPRFGIEPFARMETLQATVGLRSLWQDRMQFSSLVFVRPSLNVVLNGDGHWNLETLGESLGESLGAVDGGPASSMLEAARLETGSVEPASEEESLPSFPPFRSLPVIRVDSGRINFKSQNQKKVYVIDALDLELLPPSSSGQPWKLWFEGTPNRTDFPLHPISRVRGEAEFGPLDFASGIHAETGTPLRLDLAAENALLGDLLKVFTGNDYGMHGELNLRFHLTGTTSLLRLTGEVGVEDLHRWDLLPPAVASTLRAQIAGILDVQGGSLQLTSIAVPLAEGAVVIRGEVESLFHDPQPDWSAQFRRVPLAVIVDIVKQFTPDLDTQLLAEGVVDGRLHMEGAARSWVGSLSLSEGVLEEKRSGQIARLADFRAVFEGKTGRAEPVTVSFEQGGDLEAAVRWDLENWESTIQLRGETLPTASFLQWARAFGSRWGEADLAGGDLSFEIGVATAAGKPPQLTGWAELSGAELKSRAVNQPVQVSSARLEFQPGEVRAGPFVAVLGGMELTGNFLAKPGVAGKNNRLEVEFDFHASGIDIAELDQLLNPRHRPGAFFGFGRGSNRGSPFFDGLSARGTLHTGWVGLGGTGIENFDAAVDFRDRLLTIEHFRGEFAGGTQIGSAAIRFDSDSPAFHLESHYANMDLDRLTEASAGWGGFFSGKLNGSHRLESSGGNLNEILDRLEGSGEVAGSDLVLHGLDLSGAPSPADLNPVTGFASLSASFHIGGREVLLEELRAVTGAGTVRGRESAPELPALIVTGSVGFDRTLDLNVRRESGGHQYHWAGTLAEPRLTETVALLLDSHN